jgi:hypothetical protein
LADFWYSGVFGPKISQFGAKIKKLKKLIFLTWGTPIGVMKIFSELGTCANRFLVPENPRLPKISQFGEKNFFEKHTGRAPPFKFLDNWTDRKGQSYYGSN